MGMEKEEVGKMRMKTKHLETYRDLKVWARAKARKIFLKGVEWGQVNWLVKHE